MEKCGVSLKVNTVLCLENLQNQRSHWNKHEINLRHCFRQHLFIENTHHSLISLDVKMYTNLTMNIELRHTLYCNNYTGGIVRILMVLISLLWWTDMPKKIYNYKNSPIITLFLVYCKKTFPLQESPVSLMLQVGVCLELPICNTNMILLEKDQRSIMMSYSITVQLKRVSRIYFLGF